MTRLQESLRPHLGHACLGEDDFGNVLFYVVRDMLHLDADALNDRLHAWVARDAGRKVAGVSAFVSFHHANPATSDEPELDVQAAWHGLQPTLRIETGNPRVTEADLEGFARLVPAFLQLVDGSGRPEDWRNVDHGNAE